jgi:hypothetical protein
LAPVPPLVSLGLESADRIGDAVDRLLETLEAVAAGVGYTASIAEAA